ncbi:DUF4255 domain-containing protein [Solihabitans fulvus]|uniref:DUF4255 domain-containing protein n=1 Tax=Solihabitans fulvus TaxID=1892852 RepID=A0A5B2X445_9PSEU|nr:DUF4255 domain-containing protein [Solihabitans fulvus]KAA2258078.1 DUF4255 domain-containing protein [Solihabitans fulvus]
MIHEVDEGLRLLLAEEGLPGDGVELVFDAPTKDWAAKRNAPTVNVFLYDLREDLTRRRTGTQEEHDGDGTVVGWQEPPLWYQLSYLVSAWTTRPIDEHRLLSEVLRGVSRHDTLQTDWLTGSLAELGLAVLVDAGGAVPDGNAATDLWSGLGGQLKPSIGLRVIAPLQGNREPAGPPVTEGMVVRVGGTDEDGRRLRYEGPTTAQGTGLAPTRPKPPPGAGRRRRGRL